jgi:methionyl aminopeptidase
MILIKNEHSIDLMSRAGRLLAGMFQQLPQVVIPGVSTHDIDAWIDEDLVRRGLISQSKGYHGYRHASCISVNDVVVHGIPHRRKKIVEGDLVKIDVCAAWKGYCADMARCYFVGEPSKEARRLVEAAEAALVQGIDSARAGNTIGDISFAVQSTIESYGYGIVRDFAGHGIGRRMHEDPEILNYGSRGVGPVIKAGMAFAIEPMITAGAEEVRVLNDGWTAVTADRSLAAHVEDTVIVLHDGPFVITRVEQ